jgi:hypothetical protein
LVKLALWRFWNEHREGDHTAAAESAYDTLVTLSGGVDLAAQVERW